MTGHQKPGAGASAAAAPLDDSKDAAPVDLATKLLQEAEDAAARAAAAQTEMPILGGGGGRGRGGKGKKAKDTRAYDETAVANDPGM